MDHSELNELKRLAMVAELARPLAHECNNFLNNLLLQLAISEKSFPESSRTEWANIRREARKLASLFQQWQRQHKHAAENPTKVELAPLVDEVINELRSESAAIQIEVRPAGGPLLLHADKGDVQRLFSLAVRYAAAAQRRNGDDGGRIEMDLDAKADRILIYVRQAGAKWTDFDEVATSERTTLSLLALACKSLVERLDGTIRIEADSNGGVVLVLDLPLAAA